MIRFSDSRVFHQPRRVGRDFRLMVPTMSELTPDL